MKKMISLIVLIAVVAIAAISGAAEAVAAPAPSLLSWFMANSTVILAMLLAVTEVLALIPGFKGNGILDTIIKALQVLSKKEEQ